MQWFNQLRVTTRLIAGFLVVSVIGAVIGLLGVVNMGRMAEWTGKIYNTDLQALKAVQDGNINLVYASRAGGREVLMTTTLDGKIKAPLLLQYAELDTRINGGWPAYEEALKANKVTYTAHFYEKCNHGFHNDTTPRYDEAAAKLAWSRTLEFFNKYLKG